MRRDRRISAMLLENSPAFGRRYAIRWARCLCSLLGVLIEAEKEFRPGALTSRSRGYHAGAHQSWLCRRRPARPLGRGRGMLPAGAAIAIARFCRSASPSGRSACHECRAATPRRSVLFLNGRLTSTQHDAGSIVTLGNVLMAEKRFDESNALFLRAQQIQPLITWPSQATASQTFSVLLSDDAPERRLHACELPGRTRRL